MESLTVKKQPQSLISALSSDTRQLARRFDSELAIANRNAEVVEVSVFDGDAPATIDDIKREIVMLQSVWKDLQSDFWATLLLLVRESGMSRERLHFAVTQFMLNHTYGKSFTPAELLSIDKKIIIARTMQALRQKVHHQLQYEDIVMIEYFGERRFALKADAELYHFNILATYSSPYGYAQWVGKYNSEDFKLRRKLFGENIKPYLESYPREMCLEFYNYWSQPVQCGDIMLWETKWSQERINADGEHDNLIGEYIDEWAIEHGVKSRFITIEQYESESKCQR